MGKLIETEALKMRIKKISDRYESPYGLMKGGHETACEEILEEVNSLPQIDIVGEIEKMIEENKEEAKRAKNSPLFEPIYGYAQVRGGVLHQLLQKFKS